MNNDEAAIAALVGPWTKPGETIVQGVQNVVELMQLNAEFNSTLVMRSAFPDHLPKTTREALDRVDQLKTALQIYIDFVEAINWREVHTGSRCKKGEIIYQMATWERVWSDLQKAKQALGGDA